MKLIIAIDSFKGCLTSAEANQAAAEGIWTCSPETEIIQIPVSDGGEGWLVPFIKTLGWQERAVVVHDPLMRPVLAHYAFHGDTAAIEIAQACGLSLLKSKELNPDVATTYGVGELIVDAMRHGCLHFIVGLGGSATSDVGMGMLKMLSPYMETLNAENYSFAIATDVDNPLCGEKGAARVFAPQKGATPEMVERLEQRAYLFAKESTHIHGYDLSSQSGAGAAGGLGYAFLQYLHAKRRSGAELLMEMLHFDQFLEHADLVITGEGRADQQTLMGKLPFAIMQRAKKMGVPTLLLAGQVSDREALLHAGFHDVLCIHPTPISIIEAMKKENALKHIKQTTQGLIEFYRKNKKSG